MTSASEEWRPIPGQEGSYEVSNHGNIRSLARSIKNGEAHYMCPGGLLRCTDNGRGYMMIRLSYSGSKTSYRIHRLVAQVFVPNPYNKPQVNHIDGNKANNRAENLEWVTGSENAQHAWNTGLKERKTFSRAQHSALQNGRGKELPVIQTAVDGKRVAHHLTTSAAAAHVCVTVRAMLHAINKRRPYKGFLWLRPPNPAFPPRGSQS